MNSEIVLTGTELLLGELVDTNSVMVSKMLREIGLDVTYKTTVGDNQRRITEVLQIALSRVDIIIISGGLGPTVDDVTRQAVADATERPLIYSEALEAQIAARFKNFGREMSENNKRQAWIPQDSIPVENPVGTAPCFIVENEQGTIICLPGVPRELKYQMENAILPYLKQRMGQTQIIKARILRTCAIGESNVDSAIDDLMRLQNPTVGLAAHPGQVDVRITAKAATEAEADQLIKPIEVEVRKRLGDSIFGVDKETLAGVVGALLEKQHIPLTIVDTITAGALGEMMAEVKYATVIDTETQFSSLDEAKTVLGVTDQELITAAQNERAFISKSLQPVHQGLAIYLLGPITIKNEDTLSLILLANQNQVLSRTLRFAYASQSRQPWLLTQALDLIWRQIRPKS